ncbi:MAG: DUF4091 domain-containing protein [Thermoleophilia bacterium]|nr:DUF4091 domain-containing protein [Thermoleophilia bacterium]
MAAVLAVVTAAVVAMSMVAPATAPAVDAASMLPTRTLFLTERFSQSGPDREALTSGALPEQMVAMRGEREGFQLAVQNTTGVGPLAARIVPDGTLAEAARTGAITFELMRVGFVNLPQGSTGMGTSGGMYADPLPPFNDASTAGRLSIGGGQWGGVIALARIRTDANPATYTGSLELFTGTEGGQDEVVQARQTFSLDVRPTTLRQPGDARSFKTVMGVEGEAYWLQHPDMRNRPTGTTLWADRMAQVTGLMSFLDSRDITPLEFPFGNPANTGAYSCKYQDKGLASQSYLSQLKNRYFGKSRDIDPSSAQFPVRFMPHETYGCKPDGATQPYSPLLDKLRTKSVKQDDYLSPSATGWWRKVAGAWSTNGLWSRGATYVKNPFDEPGDASAAQRRTMTTQVPAANVALHRAVGSKAKVVLAGWPRDGRGKRICRPYKGGKRCTNLSGDTFDNRKMWDGRGLDDVDIWMPHFSRLFGRTTPGILKPYKVDRSRDYANRLAMIRKMKPGRETWAYNFFTASKTLPQLSIDAPGTDPVVETLMLARDGHTGLYVSNLMLGWSTTAQNHPGSNLRRKGNPYEQAVYFKHSVYGYGAGWGTFIYPGYVPELGLNSETLRNTEGAVPVSSLRLEGMREGTEDANLVQMYRDRHGESWTQARLRRIFPNRYVPYPRTLGNVVGPYYNNGGNLAQRIETSRRQMIMELEQPSKKKRHKKRIKRHAVHR